MRFLQEREFDLLNFRDYLSLAPRLARGPTEADWRTATSRVYYAAFHVARLLFTGLGFRAAAIEPIRTQITDAMKVYERDVLHDVTWHP